MKHLEDESFCYIKEKFTPELNATDILLFFFPSFSPLLLGWWIGFDLWKILGL